MTTKSKTTSTSAIEAAIQPARSAAKAWIDLGTEQAQSYQRLLETQLDHVQQSTRDMNEFASALTKSTLEAGEATRRECFEFASKAFSLA
jgi:hypothetical protein